MDNKDLIQNRLRAEGEVEFEGATLKFAGDFDTLKRGDTYVAERNSGPKLLTVDHVTMNVVFPVENAYPFNLMECVKVEIVL